MRTAFSLCLLLLISTLFIPPVRASPGISVTIVVLESLILEPADNATYAVNVQSLTAEDENLRLTVTGDPSLRFNWTLQESIIAAGRSTSLGLESSETIFTPGDYAFTVLGQAWPLNFTFQQALDLGILETSSFTDYVTVSSPPVVTPSNAMEQPRRTFLDSDDVFIVGSGFPPNKEVNIYILPEGVLTRPNTALASSVGRTNTSGMLPATRAWTHPLTVGEYDVWVDTNQNGTLDSRDAFSDSNPGSFALRVVLSPQPLTVTVKFTPPIVAGNSVTFIANVTGGIAPYSVSWTFGDGSSAMGLVVEHTYTSEGIYSVTGSATDEFGAAASSTVPINVEPRRAPLQAGIPWTYIGLGTFVLISVATLAALIRRSRRNRLVQKPSTSLTKSG